MPEQIANFAAAGHDPVFRTTEWSVVCAAQNTDLAASSAAIGRLCDVYWYPLYAYVRRRGYNADDAQDLTQEFFVKLLEHHWLDRVDRARGRFRWFLLMAMKRFLANEWHRAHAAKRGGKAVIESFSSEDAETRFGAHVATKITPEQQFEREWALTLLENVVNALATEYHQAGKDELFDSLKPFITAGDDNPAYAPIAERMKMSEGALRVAACRLRQRYRERLREEAARTLSKPEDVDSELRHLIRVIARS